MKVFRLAVVVRCGPGGRVVNTKDMVKIRPEQERHHVDGEAAWIWERCCVRQRIAGSSYWDCRRRMICIIVVIVAVVNGDDTKP